ncbi:HAMP domain-containing histidine kinase [Brucepastera parasyntrophica]|uniref:HAMP domain-containing sensor histidine kinase n=1 Tax=Brucepastera parasyntrophica TaxID=2880008 RepID=UPI00210CB18A|nr:HAMP domain-containing sensor histidine kinase [Brucepastera parasyntrophica]ULQ60865.1 HAMP domain-containing histidine kinase [Brucepastera parasyntrophica]
MKIKTQFYVLIGGIIMVPLLAFAAIFIILHSQKQTADFDVPAYEEVLPLFNGELERGEWENIERYVARAHADTNMTVFSKDLMVVYSTGDEFHPGEYVTKNQLLEIMQLATSQYGYILESPGWVKESHAIILVRIDSSMRKPPQPVVFMLRTFLTVIGVLLVFVVTVMIAITRSITESVLILENETRRLASGELDLPIDVKGSNEITSLTSSLNTMRLALKEEEATRTRFIMGVTHDLKTPLALIKGYAEAIVDGIADDAASRIHSVEIIVAKVDLLEGMIDDLIEFVKVNTGEWRRSLDHVDLFKFLSMYTRRALRDAELLDRKMEVSNTIPENTMVPMDERLALRAIENLVNNALRYTSAGGIIRINAFVEDNRAVIEICDNGPGIDTNDLSHIFDMFYRGTSSRREQGMGLGLSVVKGVIDSHGWEISVQSEKGVGSCFIIFIPLD